MAKRAKVKRFIKVAIVLLLVVCVGLAFMDIAPFAGLKDKLVDKILPYIQSPIIVDMYVEDGWVRVHDKYAYSLKIVIKPTSTAQLDKTYVVEASPTSWEQSVSWDILWTENPELRAPEARGFHEIIRTILITEDDLLYEHVAQLEYRKFVQMYNAYTMSEIEGEYQKELSKLVKVRVIK